METLVKNEKKISFFSKSLCKLFVKLVFGVLFVVISGASVLWMHQNQVESKNQSIEGAKITLSLIQGEISSSVNAVRNSLEIISKMPPVKKFQRLSVVPEKSRFGKAVGNLFDWILDCLDAYRPFVNQAIYESLRGQNNLAYWLEMPFAAGRRIVFQSGLGNIFYPDDVEEDTALEESGGLDSIGLLSVFSVRESIEKIKEKLVIWKNKCGRLALFIENNILGGELKLSFPHEAENLLAASMNDRDYIRTLTIVNLEGKKQAEVSEVSVPYSFGNLGSVKAIRRGKVFWAGPVSFDENLGRPIWEAAVPIRDQNREAVGALVARVDLAFLSEISKKISSKKGQSLLVVDEDGIVIGYADRKMIVNQVNMKLSNPAVFKALEGKSGALVRNENGRDSIFYHFPLKDFNFRSNPSWGMVLVTNLTELSFMGGLLMSLGVIVLAGLSLYVLFYVMEQILFLFDEEIDKKL